MNKKDAIEMLEKVKSENIERWKSYIVDEEEENKKVCETVEKLPNELFELNPKIRRGLFTTVILCYPLDKHLITKVIKILDNHDISYSDTIEYFGLNINLLDINAYIKFFEYQEGATCQMEKIGEEKVEMVKPIYEIACTGKLNV